MNEILNLAYNSELSSQNLYEKLLNFDAIFSEILAIKKDAKNLIQTYAKANNYELTKQEQNLFFTPNSLDDALIAAIYCENELNKMYENLTQNLDDEDLKDLLFRLWATSYNEYLPALKNKLAQILNNQNKSDDLSPIFNAKEPENILSNYQKDFNEMSEQIQSIASGTADKAQIAKILNNPNFSFFSGLALGALGMTALSKTLDKDDE